MSPSYPATHSSPWRTELDDIIRGACGGFLFGTPLLYTMETWWIGSYTEPPLLLIILAINFAIVFLLNRTDGFRQDRPDDWQQAAMDSVEALAIGFVCVLIMLVLLREVTPETPLNEILGKLILESVPFSIGVALGRSIMHGARNRSNTDDSQNKDAQGDASQNGGSESRPQGNAHNQRSENYNPTVADTGASLIGALFIAFNIAPTDEVSMLAAATSAPWLLCLIAASLLVSYAIVFVADFTSQEQRLREEGFFQNPILETVATYIISLIAAALMLWFFHRLSFDDSWTLWLRQTLILGFPATIGGAAGRLTV